MKYSDDYKLAPESATKRVRATSRVDTDDTSRLYGRLRAYLARLATLDGAAGLQQLLALGRDALRELFEVTRLRVCTFDTSRGYLFEDNEALDPELTDLLDWAVRRRKPVFIALDDECGRLAQPCEHAVTRVERTVRIDASTIRLARLKQANALAVLPVMGERAPQGALLAWMLEPEFETRVVEAELLEHLCSELSSRARALDANERLRSLSSLFDNILESVPHGILAISRDGRVTALNANAEFLFDLKRVFVIDEPFEDALPPLLARELKTLMEKLLLSSSVEAGIDIELRPGTRMNVGIAASWLLDRSGERQGWLFLCRDLSLSLEVQKLRDLDRLKTEFVNTVSHELKTPLTAILGGIEIILGENAISGEFRELGEVIQGSAISLRDLIFDLLNVAKLESGKVQLRLDPVSVPELLAARVKLLPPHPRHTIRVDCPEMPALMLDRERIGQAVTNYLSNALKYSPEGGEVVAAARLEDDTLDISVKDQGMGIAEENLPRVWEKFFRVDAGFTAEIEGTGLGLVIVQKIVELHAGQVYVKSVPGKGSTFGMRLPAHQPDRRPDHRRP